MVKKLNSGKRSGKSVKESKLKEAPALEPRYDSRQSFYGKAYYTEPARDGSITLYSYDTPVVRICADGEVELLPAWDYSATTLRHVREFLRQQGYAVYAKKDMPKYYTVVDESVAKKSRKPVKEGFGFGVCSPDMLMGELEQNGGFDAIKTVLENGLIGVGVVGIEADSLEDAIEKLVKQVSTIACQADAQDDDDDYYDDNYDDDGYDDFDDEF